MGQNDDTLARRRQLRADITGTEADLRDAREAAGRSGSSEDFEGYEKVLAALRSKLDEITVDER